MQSTPQNPLASSQNQGAESSLFFRQLFPPEQTAAPAELPKYENVGVAELFEALTEFKMVPPDIERLWSAVIGPERFSRLRELLLRVWESDRMI